LVVYNLNFVSSVWRYLWVHWIVIRCTFFANAITTVIIIIHYSDEAILLSFTRNHRHFTTVQVREKTRPNRNVTMVMSLFTWRTYLRDILYCVPLYPSPFTSDDHLPRYDRNFKHFTFAQVHGISAPVIHIIIYKLGRDEGYWMRFKRVAPPYAYTYLRRRSHILDLSFHKLLSPPHRHTYTTLWEQRCSRLAYINENNTLCNLKNWSINTFRETESVRNKIEILKYCLFLFTTISASLCYIFLSF